MKEQLAEQIRLLQQLHSNDQLASKLEQAIEWLCQALQKQLPVLVCGNGGSAADALHISGELVGRFFRERKALNVICLNANVSVLTAWTNDVDYDSIFARQVQAHGQPGGVCWGISTSGNSKNVLHALKQAHVQNMKTIALTGQGGGKLAEVADLLIDMPSQNTPRTQELHLSIYHYLCEQIEDRIYKLTDDSSILNTCRNEDFL